jgi:hypothetical protein
LLLRDSFRALAVPPIASAAFRIPSTLQSPSSPAVGAIVQLMCQLMCQLMSVLAADFFQAAMAAALEPE